MADVDEPTLMAQAQRAFIAGDYDTAKDLFTQVTEMDPHNTLAIRYLRNIRLRQAGQAPTPAHDDIETLVIPKIEFKDATFSSALDFFKQAAAKQSVAVSFVSELPEAQMNHTVTLNLQSIPFLDGLKYLCDLNHAVFTKQRYAIVITPFVPDTASPSPSPAQ